MEQNERLCFDRFEDRRRHGPQPALTERIRVVLDQLMGKTDCTMTTK
jgi:hypothetical protein